MVIEQPILEAKSLNIAYSSNIAVKDVSLRIPEKSILAVIGPSGCGKSTLLRSMNRMNDFIEGMTIEGDIIFRGKSIYDQKYDPVSLRRHIGMVFQKPNPFPCSIAKNITWGTNHQWLSRGYG